MTADLDWSQIEVVTPGAKPARAPARKAAPAKSVFEVAPPPPRLPTERSAPQPNDWGHCARSPAALPARRRFAIGETRDNVCFRCGADIVEWCVGHSDGGACFWETSKCSCRV